MSKILARFLLRLHGWTVNPNVPPEAQRSVMIAAPHTTNWDAYFMRLTFAVLDIPLKFTIKDFWTKLPIFGALIRAVGGLGINRSKKKGVKTKSYIEQMAAYFQTHDRLAMVVAAEGSRSLRKQWKTGFYHTAKAAGVPVTLGYLDFEKKEAGVGAVVIHLTDDMEADMKKIMAFYSTIKGKYPEKFSLDERYWKEGVDGEKDANTSIN